MPASLIDHLQVFQIWRNFGRHGAFQITDCSEIDGIGIGQIIKIAGQFGALDFQFTILRQHLEAFNFRVQLLEACFL